MKIIIAILVLLPTLLKAQDSTIRSKYENFVSKSGQMIKTTWQDVDKVKDTKITLITSTDVEKGNIVKALYLSQNKSFLLSPISSGSLYIDFDELPEFIKALKYLNQQINNEKPSNLTTFSYSTINGVTATASYSTESFMKGWSFGLSQVYKYSRASMAGSNIILKGKEIDSLIEAIEKSLSF